MVIVRIVLVIVIITTIPVMVLVILTIIIMKIMTKASIVFDTSIRTQRWCDWCCNPARLICYRCKSVRYCDRECARLAWGTHKDECVFLGVPRVLTPVWMTDESASDEETDVSVQTPPRKKVRRCSP